MELLTDYQRGKLVGILMSQEMIIDKLRQEADRTDIPYLEYNQQCAFLGIIFIEEFKKLAISILNDEVKNGQKI